MSRHRILDPKLMSKVAKATGKRDITAVNVMVSQRASKLGISSEAALVLIAKEHGIGTSTYQRTLDPAKQAEIRDALPAIFAPPSDHAGNAGKREKRPALGISNRTKLKLAIEYIIQDEELRGRCEDILLARSHFDRPINQATTVLEERIRRKAKPDPTRRFVGESLVNYAFNERLDQSLLQVASNDPDDQRGVTQILRGIFSAFRNRTHHHITDSFSREEAMRVCGMIDVLLRVVDNSVKK